MRRTAVYTKRDQKMEDILMEHKIKSIRDYIKYDQENCISHVNRMEARKSPKAILRSGPHGKD
jgi:hypothetical protein